MKSQHKTLVISLVVVINLIIATSYAQNTSLPVGTIPGSADVTAMGAATYNIPIEVVPGTQGVQPNLSVAYNSMAGTGILGNHWDLVGLSVITRVGQNTFLDQRSTSVSMRYFDRFELDGNRLICSDPTYYGSNGTLYQPEFEDFSKIYSYGTVGFGPEYFIVYHDDGSVVEYGNTADSKQRLSNGIYSWYVNKITDINGNYMTFSYGYSGSEIWIDHIDYTGNTVAGLTPYARVSFTYDTYTQIGSTFVAGYEIPQTRLLRAITVQYKNGSDYELVRQYQFSYTEDFPKRLVEVGLMGSDGSELNQTKMEWNGTSPQDHVDTTMIPLQYLESEKKHVAVDFNRDGKCDLFVYGENAIYFYNNQNGNFTYSNYHYDANSQWFIRKSVPADMDGDGYSELITAFTDYNKHMTYVTRTSFPFQTDTLFPVFQTNGYKDIVTGDFLGNGQNQVVVLYQGPSSCYIRSSFQSVHQSVTGGNIDVVDFDGDGQMELMILDETTLTNFTIYKYDETLNSFTTIYQGAFNSAFRASGDFNGDGISDVLIGQSNSFYTGLGTGTGFVIKPANQTFGLHNTLGTYRINPMVVDINNDGYDDVLVFNKTADGLKVVCYVGCGYYKDTVRFQNKIAPSTLPVFLESFELNRHDFTFGDFNDDHHLDLISYKTIDALHDGVLLYEFKMDKRVPQVNKVTAGDGSFVRWMYQDIYGLHYRYASHISILPYQYNVVESMTETLGGASQTNTQLYSFQKPTFSFLRMQRMGFLKTSKTDVNRQKTDSLYSQVVKNDYGVSQEILMPAVQKTYFSSQLSESIEYQTQCLLFSNGKRRLPYIIKTLDTNQLDMSVIIKMAIRWPHTGRLQVESTVIKNASDYYPQVTERTEYRQTTHTMPSGSFITLNDSIITEMWMNNNSSIKSVQKQYFTYNNRYLPEQINVVMDGVSTSKTIQNYDCCGNGILVTDSGDSCLARTITSLYDNTGRFCVFESSGPSFHISRIFSPKKGLLLSITDENDLTTTYTYDVFGKLTAVHHPDGNTDTIRYGWYMYDEIPNAKYYSLTHVPGRTFDTERYYDLLGRNICTRENGFFTDTCYDIKGNVYRVSAPYIRGTSDANKIWRFFQYDQFGRTTSEVGPYSNVSYQYAGYTTTVTDNLRQTASTRTTDAVGRVISVTDPGGTITFNYSHVLHNGRIATQTNVTACGHTSQILSDASGNRLRIVDPNAGAVTCRYNAHNQPLQQTDANGNNIRFQYDEWGRLTRKTNITPSNGFSEVFLYSYDHYTSTNHGRGKLYRVSRNDTLCEQYTYNTLSRLAQHTRYVDDTSYSETYAYNTYGQLATLTYPDGFTTRFTYNGKGQLSQIDQGSNSSLIYYIKDYNVYGQPQKCRFGNGTSTEYEYNATGLLTRINTGNMIGLTPIHPPIDPFNAMSLNGLNTNPVVIIDDETYTVDSTIQNFRYTYDNMGRLTQRTQKNSQYETFQYDNMDRLTSFTQGTLNGSSQTFTTTYDLQGNILSNTLAGTYRYDSNKPHAVTEVTPSTNFPNAFSAFDCITEYNVFNQPSRIAEGDMEILLEYGADNQRVKAVFKEDGHTLYTRYYISPNYEKEVDVAGVTTHYNYVYGVNGLAAICVRRNGVDSMYYVHPDRLGSYTHITDRSRRVIRALHFDPWGNVKSDADWKAFVEDAPVSLTSSFRFSRGFTGHEHYADLKIINMNGRLYDPVIARFFSPDNFVQVPDFTQSYNRYSYCLNNPLQWVDPSGELSFNDWYIDSKRNLQWFESTSDYVEVNGEIYSRVGSTVIRFSSNGQKIYGDEYGGIHYIYPLGEVVIGKDKQQEAISSSEIEIELNYPQNASIILSNLFSIAGLRMEQSSSTFSLTDSKGNISLHYYKSGWLGNQYVKTFSIVDYAKYFEKTGKALGWIDVGYNGLRMLSTDDIKKKVVYGFDAGFGLIGIYGGGYGIALSLYYSAVIKNYPQIQQNVNKQYEDRANMMLRGYIPVGTPGFPFK